MSLKFCLNLLVYHQNILGSSSKVFGILQTSWEMFGNSQKMFGIVCLAFKTILENLRKSSENHQKRCHQYIYVIKEHYTLAWRYEFCVLMVRTISHSFAALIGEILFLPLEHKIHINSPPCNILYIIVWSPRPRGS